MSFVKKLNRLDNIFKPDNYILVDKNPVGTILTVAADLTDSIPANYLYCNGASLARTGYAALYNVIGTNWGTADSNHFNLPDLRGFFLRGHDDNTGNDNTTDRNNRTASETGGETGDKVGTYQADQVGSHLHAVPVLVATATSSGVNPKGTNTGSSWTTINSNSTGGNQTNPRNLYVQYYIKYQ